MDIFTYKKEQLIIIKNNFITNELINDIIEIIYDLSNENLSLDDKNFSKNQNWEKIKNYLIHKINKELSNYKIMINSKSLFINTKNEFSTINFEYLNKSNFEFIIENNNTFENSCDINISNRFEMKDNIVSIKIFKYIIFLNDYDKEIIFWETYKIKPQKGSILIFPVSWCFPYYELVNKESKYISINGYVKNTINFNK
jgi:hypothetical protein